MREDSLPSGKATIQPMPLSVEPDLATMHQSSTFRRITKNQCSWWVHSRNPAFWDRGEQGTWEPLTCSIFDRFLDREHSCLDISAWIGPDMPRSSSITSTFSQPRERAWSAKAY